MDGARNNHPERGNPDLGKTNAYVLLFMDVLGMYARMLLSFRHVYID